MTNATISRLDELQQSGDADATIAALIDTLREQKDYRALFEALMLQRKRELGLSLLDPSSLDVPEEHREAVEESFVETARHVGGLFLEDGRILDAWPYFRTIQETGPIAAALDAMPVPREPGEDVEELINVALYEGANPVKGLAIMLRCHGTCNTITSLDQQIHQFAPADRRGAAALLVDEVYTDLCHTVQQEVNQKLAMTPPGESLRELIAGREWLFAEGNYHIDVSHLHSVVRFARFLNGDDPQLARAIELAEYGSQLDRQFQYPGDPPFDEYYPAHREYFKALAGVDRDAALVYFRDKLDAEPDEEDKPMLAYVLVDLQIRSGRLDDAVATAERYLKDVEDPSGFSFTSLCRDAGRVDVLKRASREKGDVVGYAAALLESADR